MHILAIFGFLLFLVFILIITKPKKKYKNELSLKNIRVGDKIYYYDRWWEVMSVRGDIKKPKVGMIEGKDKDGNISANISFDDVTDYKPQK